jgi:hypothetical protein
MTEFSIPPLVIDYGGWWIDVNLREDPHIWAQHAAPEVLARWGKKAGHRRKELVKVLDAAAQAAREARDATAVLLLYPELGGEIRAFVRLVPVDLSGHDGDSAWKVMLDWLVPTQESGILIGSPEVTDLQTPAGACKRIRFQKPRKDNEVGEHLTYAWVFPQCGAGAALATSFADLAEAERWRPALDDLAASASLDQSAA